MKVVFILFLYLFAVGCAERTGGVAVSESVADGPQDGLGEADDPSIDDADLIDGSVLPEGSSPEDDVENPSQGQAPSTPAEQVTFKIDPGLFALNNGENSVAVRWDGCEETQYSMGGYESDTQCGKAFLHPDFNIHLQKHFKSCILDASADAGLNRPEEIFIRHVGTFNNRPARGSSKKSMHAYARAMDIRNINLFDRDGAVVRISTHIRDYEEESAVFYDSFRRCWADSLPENCVPGKNEYLGSIGHTSSQLGGNSLHADHLHLSFPFCGGGS